MASVESGISGGTGFALSTGGRVRLPGAVEVDLTTSVGLATARSRLDPSQVAELERLMRAMGYELRGGAFVAVDAFAIRAVDPRLGGPGQVAGGRDELDDQLAGLFAAAGLPDPYNAATTPAVGAGVAGTPAFARAVAAVQRAAEAPSDGAAAQAGAALGGLAASAARSGSVVELLYVVFRESIRETNEAKKHFLSKLQDFNTMAEDLSSYLDELTAASERLARSAEGKEGEDYNKATVLVEVRDYDLGGLDGSGHLLYTSDGKDLTREDLNNRIKTLESAQETIRNDRQMATTSFQSFDQKSQQLFNLMATVLKATHEMALGAIRNMT